MLRQVDLGRLVRGSEEVHDQFVLFRQGVAGADIEVAGIAFVAVGTEMSQLETGSCAPIAERGGSPDRSIEAVETAVQVVGRPVGREMVLSAIQREPGSGNAVDYPADDRAEVGRVVAVVFEGVV